MRDDRPIRKKFTKEAFAVGTGVILGLVCLSPLLGASPPTDGTLRSIAGSFLRPGSRCAQPYTPGVLAADTLWISGQIDKDPNTGRQPEGIAAQTHLAMDNMGQVLRAAGLDYGNVVSCHVQLADMGQFAAMNEVYGSYFGPDYYPARTTLEVGKLPDGANIEVTCIAYTDKSKIAPVVPPAGSIPSAVGPYRPAVWAGDTLYVSGTTGRDPKTNEVDATVEGQTRQAMNNIGQILKAAGLEQTDAVFTNVYYLDSDDQRNQTYAKLNSVYKDFFPLGLAPSRASFCVSKLPGTSVVELTYIASRDHKNGGRVIPVYNRQNQTSSRGGVLAGDTLYTSGRSAPGETTEKQLRDSLETIRDILKLAGMNMEHVVDAHVYLKDIAQVDVMNAVFTEYFPTNPPARTIVQVNLDQLIQVQAVAVR